MAHVNKIWKAPLSPFLKVKNFDIVRNSFSVIVGLLSDQKGDIVATCAKTINFLDVNIGEVEAALLVVGITSYFGSYPLIFEGDFLVIITAIKNPSYC